jgi:hypothetical protein
MYKSSQKHKNENVVCDLEIIAVKQVLSDPLTKAGYTQLVDDIDRKFEKLEKFIKNTLRK